MNAPMHLVLLYLIRGTGALLAGLTLLIIANKAWREWREAAERRRRALLEPAVFQYVHESGHRAIQDSLPKPPRRGDRRLAEAILLDAARVVKGESAGRVTAAFEALGSARLSIQALRSRRWWRRAEAAERLGLMRTRTAIDPLIAAMGDPEEEVRIRAARALGLIRGTTSIRPLVKALGDPSRWSAIRVAEILIRVGAEAVEELLAAYEGLPHHGRVSALDILGRIKSLKAVPLLRRSLQDPSADLRARAAHGLGRIGDPAFAADLMPALKDADWPVRAMAAKALGQVGARGAIPALSEALADRQWWVRANAGEALRALGPEGRDALIRMLDAPDTYARHQAVAQLEEGRIVDDYVSDIASPDPVRRDAAIRFIEKVISLRRFDRLAQQAAENAEEAIRRALTRALRGEAHGDGA
jgi:HEAT repeat protein